MKASISAAVFKQTIKEATRFPMASALAGSELLYMRVTATDGKPSMLRIYGGLGVLSRTRGRAISGELPWIAVDSRGLVPFADRAVEPVEILIASKDKEIRFRSGDHRLDVALSEGPKEEPKASIGTEFGTISEADTAALKYLAAIVPDVQTRPDLSCIAVNKKRGIASSQRTVAVVKLEGFATDGYLPAPLARDLQAGDIIYTGKGSCTLVSGRASYTTPLPDEIRNFPIASVESYLKAKRTAVALCDGSEFSAAMVSCRDCLGFVSKLGAFVEITTLDGKLEFKAQSGAARFSTKIAAKIQTKDTVKMYAPISDAADIAPLCERRELSLSIGAQNGELYVASDLLDVIVASGRTEE